MSARLACAAGLALALAGPAGSAAGATAEAAGGGAWCGAVLLGIGVIDGTPGTGALAGQAEGGTSLLDLLLCRRRHAGADGARHLHLAGHGLPLDGSRLALDAGVQGRWWLRAGIDRLPTRPLTGFTVHAGPGSADLRLPQDWQPAPTTAGMTALPGALPAVGLAVDRRRTRLQALARLAGQWRAEVRYAEHRQQGLRSLAGLLGNGGGNARSVFVPVPVDQRSRDVELALRHAGDRVQGRLWLLLSRFDNALDGFTFDNPYAGVAGWHPAASHPTGRGGVSLAPDNRLAQLGLSLASALPGRTRVNLDVARGRLRQDQAFAPYTVNPLLAQTLQSPLPRTAFDGRVETTLAQLRLSGRPADRWHWQAGWRFDERDNRSPRDEYIGIGGDSQAQQVAPDSSRRRFNLPGGHREQRLWAQGRWRLRGNEARLGLSHRRTDRTWSARSDSDETAVDLVLRGALGSRAGAGLRLARSDRGGGAYLGSRPFLDSHAPAYTATVPGQFENLPGLRQYHLADRRRQQAAASVHWQPAAALRIEATLAAIADDYRRSEFGLQRTRIRDHRLELAWQPQSPWSGFAFLAREHFDADQAGRAFSGGAARLAQAADPARDWTARHRDRIDSAGAGMRREFADGRWRLGLDAGLSRAVGRATVRTGPALTSAPLPDSESRLLVAGAEGEWRLSARDSVALRWRLERVRSRDFASDGVGPAQLANVILTGGNAPDYTSQVVLLSWQRRW